MYTRWVVTLQNKTRDTTYIIALQYYPHYTYVLRIATVR